MIEGELAAIWFLVLAILLSHSVRIVGMSVLAVFTSFSHGDEAEAY
jgi:hypothetical protein